MKSKIENIITYMKKIKTISDLTTQEFLVLFRHWKWADMVREQYQKSEVDRGRSLLFEQKNGFKFIWYGLVYVVVEFLDEQEISFSAITKGIDSVRDQLRLCRNATFHIQSNLFTDKYSTKILLGIAEPVIKDMHSEIGNCIRNDFDRRIAEIPPKVKMMHNIAEKMPEEYLIQQLYFLQGHY